MSFSTNHQAKRCLWSGWWEWNQTGSIFQPYSCQKNATSRTDGNGFHHEAGHTRGSLPSGEARGGEREGTKETNRSTAAGSKCVLNRKCFRWPAVARGQATIYIDYYVDSPVAVTKESYFPLQPYPYPNFNNTATENYLKAGLSCGLSPVWQQVFTKINKQIYRYITPKHWLAKISLIQHRKFKKRISKWDNSKIVIMQTISNNPLPTYGVLEAIRDGFIMKLMKLKFRVVHLHKPLQGSAMSLQSLCGFFLLLV